MELDVTPSVGESTERALRAALAAAAPGSDRIVSAWREMAIREAVERDDADERYAFSPRSTRGATRA